MMAQMVVIFLEGFPAAGAVPILVFSLIDYDRAYNYDDSLIRWFCCALLSSILILMVQQMTSVAFIVGMMLMLSKFVRWRLRRSKIVHEIQLRSVTSIRKSSHVITVMSSLCS